MAKVFMQLEATVISNLVTEYLDLKKAEFDAANGGVGNPTWSMVDLMNYVKRKIKYDNTFTVSNIQILVDAWATANGYSMVTYS